MKKIIYFLALCQSMVAVGMLKRALPKGITQRGKVVSKQLGVSALPRVSLKNEVVELPEVTNDVSIIPQSRQSVVQHPIITSSILHKGYDPVSYVQQSSKIFDTKLMQQVKDIREQVLKHEFYTLYKSNVDEFLRGKGDVGFLQYKIAVQEGILNFCLKNNFIDWQELFEHYVEYHNQDIQKQRLEKLFLTVRLQAAKYKKFIIAGKYQEFYHMEDVDKVTLLRLSQIVHPYVQTYNNLCFGLITLAIVYCLLTLYDYAFERDEIEVKEGDLFEVFNLLQDALGLEDISVYKQDYNLLEKIFLWIIKVNMDMLDDAKKGDLVAQRLVDLTGGEDVHKKCMMKLKEFIEREDDLIIAHHSSLKNIIVLHKRFFYLNHETQIHTMLHELRHAMQHQKGFVLSADVVAAAVELGVSKHNLKFDTLLRGGRVRELYEYDADNFATEQLRDSKFIKGIAHYRKFDPQQGYFSDDMILKDKKHAKRSDRVTPFHKLWNVFLSKLLNRNIYLYYVPDHLQKTAAKNREIRKEKALLFRRESDNMYDGLPESTQSLMRQIDSVV